jgi:hypothetical protein
MPATLLSLTWLACPADLPPAVLAQAVAHVVALGGGRAPGNAAEAHHVAVGAAGAPAPAVLRGLVGGGP